MHSRLPYFLLFTLFLMFSLNSCREEKGSPVQQKVYADFYVRYLEPEQELKAYAAFIEGQKIDEGHPKTFPGGVNFMSARMDPKKLSDETIRYHYAAKKNFTRDFSFSFIQDDGLARDFKTSLNKIDGFQIREDASRSKGLELNYTGTALEAGESLLLLFTDSLSQAYTLQTDGPAGTTVTFGPDQLRHLPVGKMELYLVRKKLVEGLQENYDYRFALEYYSDILTVAIGE